MNARSQKWGRLGSGLVLVALVLGLVLPTATAGAAPTTVLISVLEPSWTAPGGGGVWAGYCGPPDYWPCVSPGSTAIFDGREAGIIKAGKIMKLSKMNKARAGSP